MAKEIKFHAIGDVHIADRHMAMCDEAMAKVIVLIEKRPDVHLVVIMGDILDRHNNVKLTHQRKAINWIHDMHERCKQNNIVLAVIIGNHDRPNNQDCFSDIHPFMGIQDVANSLYIVSKPKAIVINEQKILLMPYVSPGRFMEGFNAYMNGMHKQNLWRTIHSIKDFHLVFGHQECKGAPYGPVVSTIGDEWPLDYPMLISGHIHTRIKLQENLLYTGSLYPITVSEGSDKGAITGTYRPSDRHLEFKVLRVVTSQKKIERIAANEIIGVTAMRVIPDANTKYVVSGTAEEVAAVKQQMHGIGVNVAYDVRPHDRPKISNASYDAILKDMIAGDEGLAHMLEECMA